MKFAAKASVDFEIAPAGSHIAICNGVIDVGLQPGRGQYPDPKHEVYLRFELPTETVTFKKDGKETTGPMSVGRFFTASMSEKANLRKFIEGWFAKKFPNDEAAADFDFKKLLGLKCLLNITHTEKGSKTYANITSASPVVKGMTADFKQQNPSLYFSIETSTNAEFNALPEWMRKKIDGRIQEQPKSADGYDNYEPVDQSDVPF
jgi:hypothetical protein